MNLALTTSNPGTPTWIAITVALIAATASIVAAFLAWHSARSSKRLEIQAQRIRDLESRISERKYKMYEPFLEMVGNFFDQTGKGRAAIADPEVNVERFVEFAKQITTYGSDEVVEAYHKWHMATATQTPFPILTRLMADFLLAVRKDLSYPDTQISGTTLIATTFRVNDFYQQGNDFRKIMTLPLPEACKLANWKEPWVFSNQPASIGFKDNNYLTPPSDLLTKSSGLPVSIYLTDEAIHEQVENAVDDLLSTANLNVDERDDPIIGSWFRTMRASAKKAIQSPMAREAALTATHIADSRLVLNQDAYITATLLQNLGPVLQSLQPTKDAVLRVGALLIVKVDWVVQVFQLTAAQQAMLDHQPQLASSPHEIIAALQLASSDEQTVPPTSQLPG